MVGALRRSSGRTLSVLIAGAVLATLLGFAGLPQVSAAQDRGRDSRGELCADAARLTFRVLEHLDATLADLVADGTLTQEQADTVAASLTGGDSNGIASGDSERGEFAGRCAGIAQSVQATMQTVSDLLGLEWTEIRDRLEDGESLAEIAESANVSRDELIDALQVGVLERLDEAEADGRITPEERAEREEAALARIERRIDRHHDGSESQPESQSDAGTPASDS